ncbi:hypothetical protein DFJ58DRAFT_841156 [Suillus subalutaceus]|uniref:uncharacterized protein n=1 Tax=Suillus subalutaceus TaxID=48586 RepID=UPI001B8798AC|nr:uncharacterized protein DFJ58DRAFT_841156 [Suillus subalutaceus]KAG1855365.1 hypothetical protein DFJ58DRAFT_841156 [Suillus subalutaceus]
MTAVPADSGNAQSISPPLTIDVPTMLACQHLARVLADVYSNPSTMRPSINALLGWLQHMKIPLWARTFAGEALDAISPWIKPRWKTLQLVWGPFWMKSMTSGLDTQWRTFPGNFHASDQRQLTPGCINLAPCWFMQGREPHGLPPADGFTPEVSAALKGKGGPEIMISMHIRLQYNSGAMVGCSGHFVRHGVTYTGDHIVWAWFIHDSLQNFVGTPQPSYATYMGVD